MCALHLVDKQLSIKHVIDLEVRNITKSSLAFKLYLCDLPFEGVFVILKCNLNFCVDFSVYVL